MRTRLRIASSAAEYLGSVYRDERFLSIGHHAAAALLANLSFVYLSGLHLFNVSCKSSFHDWRPAMSEAIDGRVALLHRAPNAIWEMSFYGFWRPQSLQMRFIADGTWVEVLRIASTWRLGEGGMFGCWFEASRGSGAAIFVGRSLRVANRSSLASELGLNLTKIFAKPVRGRQHLWQSMRNASSTGWPPPEYAGIALDDEPGLRRRYFDNNPWRLEEKIDLCRPALRLGYNTIQIFHELCSRDLRRQACGIEMVSCHESCLRLRNRHSRLACVPGMPLRTGLGLTTECVCNNASRMLNCAGTDARQHLSNADGGKAASLLPDPEPLRTPRLNARLMRLPSCECSWCEGNRSHVTRNTDA